MKAKLVNALKSWLYPKALVLMYHRIAPPEQDVWDIAVSPEKFEEQLKVLQKKYRVLPLQTLVAQASRHTLKRNSIAITFDDGYADNFLTALPLLQKYQLPATFFICSGNIGENKEFWWDELEKIFLLSPALPAILPSSHQNEQTLSLAGEEHLTEELRQKHQSWKAGEQEPVSLRSAAFFALWQALKPLPHPEQQKQLVALRQWAGISLSGRTDFRSVTAAELQQLSQHPLVTIGAHTVTHPALAAHSLEYQTREMRQNKLYLEKTISKPVTLLTYPYGNYNHTTLEAAQKNEFAAAFTTQAQPVTSRSTPLQLGRFQVTNQGSQAFEKALIYWQKI